MFLKFYYQELYNHLVHNEHFKDILVLKNEVCYHGNQRVAVLVSCTNTEESVLAYDQIHLDDVVALTK